MNMIGIINYGMGNLKSVQNALDYLKIQNSIIEDPGKLKNCDKIILPGVGAFGKAMENLISSGFADSITEEVVVKKKPILGICLGMQLMLTDSCEHGFNKGLDLVSGSVRNFRDSVRHLPIPHMGWNQVIPTKGSLIMDVVPSSFYFVHSFYCDLNNELHASGKTDYGITFHSMLECKNYFGCQFHPEKSQKAGLNLFLKFDSF